MRSAVLPVALAGLLSGARFAEAAAPGPMQYRLPPAWGSSPTGWDLRDENNRPVRDPALERWMEAASVAAAFQQAFGLEAPTFQQILELVRARFGKTFLKLAGLAGALLAQAAGAAGPGRPGAPWLKARAAPALTREARAPPPSPCRWSEKALLTVAPRC